MFLPIGDEPNPHTAPWITRILIAINAAVFVFVSLPLERQRATREELRDPEIAAVLRALDPEDDPDVRPGAEERRERVRRIQPQEYSRYDIFVMKHGYKPGAPEFLDLLLCMFLHGGFAHLFGNMLFLWIYGDNVEARLGPFGYLFAYLLTGVAATLTFAGLNGASMVPLVGASGAISGVLGFYLIWFPFNRVKFLIWLYLIVDVIRLPAAFVLLFYVLFLQNILPLLAGGGGGVAHWAHIGGFAAGVVGAFLVNMLFGRRPAPHPTGPLREHVDRTRAAGGPARVEESRVQRFERALRERRMEDAAYEFANLVREGGAVPAPSEVFALGNWLYENGFARDAAAVFRYYIARFARGDDLDRVHLGLGLLLSRRMGQATAAREHLLTAIDLAGEGSALAETARAELRSMGG